MKKRYLWKNVLGSVLILGLCMVNPTEAKAANAEVYRQIFDADYYYNAYPDVASALGHNDAALYQHFVQYGLKEGRSGCAEFNLASYKARYADLQAAFGTDDLAYCSHYISYGKAEGRVASASGQASTLNTTVVNAPLISALGTYTTTYVDNIPRAVNVELAASRINGVVIQPQGKFSFSSTILPRSAMNGYVVAPIFINGTTGAGIGGGVCQVSSTLYAAMLQAGLPATERHAHSLMVDYLPIGMDATIAGNYKDLKFTNTFPYAIKIQAYAQEGTLTVSLVRAS